LFEVLEDLKKSVKMLPNQGRSIQEEMSRFEAEINAARAQQFLMARGGAPRPGVPPATAVTIGTVPTTVSHHGVMASAPISFDAKGAVIQARPARPTGTAISAPPSGAVISAPPSGAVISAPPSRTVTNDDDDDIMATLMKYEKEVKPEPKKPTHMTALAKDIASKKAKMKAETEAAQKKAALKAAAAAAAAANAAQNKSAAGTSKGPTSVTISDETIKKAKQKKRVIRTGGGQVWEDESLKDWDPNDFRIFCGDLGNDVTDEVLARTFGRYSSFQKAKVIRDKRTNKTKGFGFVSFKDPSDFTRAMREMNGKYVGSRPIKMKKSAWKDRNIDVVKTKIKEKQKMGYKW